MCPICLAINTNIATPEGPVLVQNVRVGSKVWSVDKNGNKVAATVVRTTQSKTMPTHRVVHLVLTDSRELWVSPNHPLTNGSHVGGLQPGDIYDGAKVKIAELVPYRSSATYDILPDSDTGYYFADGILLGSTIHQ
ncbi:MAG: Hint domain-containing protein [bacterium]|nr:Hint domain-containing protein [bacterium]